MQRRPSLVLAAIRIGACIEKHPYDHEQVKPPTMSRVVAGLERSGLVRKCEDPVDARKTVLTATARGSKVLHDARIRRVEFLADRLSRLSQEEVHVLSTVERLLRSAIGRGLKPDEAIETGRRSRLLRVRCFTLQRRSYKTVGKR